MANIQQIQHWTRAAYKATSKILSLFSFFFSILPRPAPPSRFRFSLVLGLVFFSLLLLVFDLGKSFSILLYKKQIINWHSGFSGVISFFFFLFEDISGVLQWNYHQCWIDETKTALEELEHTHTHAQYERERERHQIGKYQHRKFLCWNRLLGACFCTLFYDILLFIINSAASNPSRNGLEARPGLKIHFFHWINSLIQFSIRCAMFW